VKTIDIIIAIPLLIGALSGFRKGLILEIAGFLALILGLIGGIKLLDFGIRFLSENFHIQSSWLPVIAFLLIFIVIILIVHSIGWILKKMMSLIFLGWIDRISGAVLGVLKWAFTVSALIWLFSHIGMEISEQNKADSLLYPYVVAFAPKVFSWISEIFPSFTVLLESFIVFISEKFKPGV
jgi:membrane protein required for colicin V production